MSDEKKVSGSPVKSAKEELAIIAAEIEEIEIATKLEQAKTKLALAKRNAELKEKALSEAKDVEIVMNLAPAAGGMISHAGTPYYNGHKYVVAASVARDLAEIQNRSWSHEASLHESENKGRRKQRITL